jgi:hypothetical protein
MNWDADHETLLTAYALGELDDRAADRARALELVESDDAARQFVDDTRATAGLVTGALEHELLDDGLTLIEIGVLEQRMREHDDRQNRALRQRDAARSLRLRRWVPLAAGLAASAAVVATALLVVLPRYNRPPIAAGTPHKDTGPAVARAPGDASAVPGMPGVGEDASVIPFEEHATNAAPGDGDEGPVDGMVDPREFAARLEAERREAADARANADAQAAPADGGRGSPLPAPRKAADSPPVASRMGPARSAEAERVRPPAANAPSASINPKSPAARGAAERLTKSGKSQPATAANPAAPRLYENPFRDARQRPRSSFPVKVESASYPAVRAALLSGKFPSASAVRIEELINRFAYDGDAAPLEGAPPLSANVEVATCPWDVDHRLARVAVRARHGGATVVARGVEVAVEFNPDATVRWRLIGYENAPLSADKRGAGFPADLTAGAAATALYEIVPTTPVTQRNWTPRDLFTLKLTYREPHDLASTPQTIELPATDTGKGFDLAGADFKFASSVAAFGMLLRDSQFQGTATYADVMRWAKDGKGADLTGERAAFVELARAARDLSR